MIKAYNAKAKEAEKYLENAMANLKLAIEKKDIYIFMKSKTIVLIIGTSTFLLMNTFTYSLSNIWMLTTDHNNYIPKESNIFQFTPIQIDEGSGGYWRYAKDAKNFYYFSETEESTYYKIIIKNDCVNFNPTNFKTWCKTEKVKNTQ